jgi:hypothetical protein
MSDDKYEIRVAGRLGPVLRAAFRPMRCEVVPRQSVIQGRLSPAELHRLLEKVRMFGLELVRLDVARHDEPDEFEPDSHSEQPRSAHVSASR